MSVRACVCMRLNAVISSWSPSRLSNQWRLGGVWKQARPHTPHTWLQCLCPTVSSSAVWITVRGTGTVWLGSSVSGQICWPVQHHLGGIKSSDSWASSRWYVCMIWYCVFSLALWFDTEVHEAKKFEDCVYNPNPLQRGMRDGEAQNSASTKIIITCFFAAPSAWKSQPAAITGARMNSCLEMPEAIRLSSGAQSLSSLPWNRREGRWGLFYTRSCCSQTHS